MALPTKEVLGILVDNLKIRECVLPISKKAATRWAIDLGIPRGGETVIYTGLMYQLTPYITGLVNALERMEGSFLLKFIKLGRLANKIINISKFFGRVNKQEITKYDKTLSTIARLLKKTGIDFGYLYADELYTGALIYDLGADEALDKHIIKVYKNLKKHNVKKVITVDPHTTNMLREVFPEKIKDFNIEVKSYIEVLVENKIKPVKHINDNVVLHDSCVYARYEDIIDEPRILLENAGMKISEPEETRKFTYCCGGPVESLFPDKALVVGKDRIQQLKKAGENAVVMCPICYANLSRSVSSEDNIKINDITDFLNKAYLDNLDLPQK
jgi:Fe-S oxidoreductase